MVSKHWAVSSMPPMLSEHVTAGHYCSQLMTTANANCHWPAAARFTEHGQLGIVACYKPASRPTGHAPCSVKLGSRGAAMSCGWEGNRRSGIAPAVRHRLQWFIHLPGQGSPTLIMGYGTLPTLRTCKCIHFSHQTVGVLSPVSSVTHRTQRTP